MSSLDPSIIHFSSFNGNTCVPLFYESTIKKYETWRWHQGAWIGGISCWNYIQLIPECQVMSIHCTNHVILSKKRFCGYHKKTDKYTLKTQQGKVSNIKSNISYSAFIYIFFEIEIAGGINISFWALNILLN